MADSMQSIGKKGEDLAVDFLQAKGYDLIARNYRHRRGEIDLITRFRELLIFVEVKYRSRSDFGEPETFVSERQQELILAAAENYTYERQWEGDIRFDIVAISEVQGRQFVEHFEDAFF